MFGVIISLLILAALAVLFAWLARRAWGSKRAWLKWPGVVLAGLLTLVLALVAAIGVSGTYKLYAPRNVPVPPSTAAGTPEQIARGEHLAEVLCAACHSANDELPLSGGGESLSAEVGMPFGDIYAPNLTPGGALKDWSDGEIFRVIRTGVNDEGRATFMAMIGSRLLSDEDTLALVAYLRASPSAQNQTPEFKPTLLLALFVGAGMMNIEPSAADPIAAPPKAVTLDYGKYVLNFVDCAGCHGPRLAGDAPPPAPPSPNLTTVMPQWSKDEFFTAMRTGVTPDGDAMDAVAMPWKAMGKLDDVELEAMYLYLHGLTPVGSE